MRNIAANVLTILIIVGLLFLAGLGLARQQISAEGPSTDPVSITVERGARIDQVADQLADTGAIRHALLFRLAARYSGQAQQLKFGEYEIPPKSSIEDILAMLSKGGNVFYQVTIPEGMTVSMAIDRLKETENLTGEIVSAPEEGSLFPDTYNFQDGETREDLIRRMQDKMIKVLDEAWEARDLSLPLANKQEMLILASIVEKETRPQEHRKVASVFVNRMRKGMKLQTDPTVIYGITLGKEALGRGLRRSELSKRTPYNTYIIEGLPPTPIANPGRESIMAVANPATTTFLYFVADGTGGHAFAETLSEHNRNVAAWRKIERERKANE